ncbi:MAG: hypothetical protein KGL12_02280 [Rhodospirillales bacterium]|nr:hypothetical protein [Rhodospirillales bacterium]
MRIRTRKGVQFYARVEKLPDFGWDWILWPAGAAASVARYGRSTTARAAMSTVDEMLERALARIRQDAAKAALEP